MSAPRRRAFVITRSRQGKEIDEVLATGREAALAKADHKKHKLPASSYDGLRLVMYTTG